MEGDNNPTGLRFPPALLLEVGIKARLRDMGGNMQRLLTAAKIWLARYPKTPAWDTGELTP